MWSIGSYPSGNALADRTHEHKRHKDKRGHGKSLISAVHELGEDVIPSGSLRAIFFAGNPGFLLPAVVEMTLCDSICSQRCNADPKRIMLVKNLSAAKDNRLSLAAPQFLS